MTADPRVVSAILRNDFYSYIQAIFPIVSPGAAFVYVSNRGGDDIAVYAVDQGTGVLSPLEWVSTQGVHASSGSRLRDASCTPPMKMAIRSSPIAWMPPAAS
jgi:Lactonase, 7-bladed beta-propeller